MHTEFLKIAFAEKWAESLEEPNETPAVPKKREDQITKQIDEAARKPEGAAPLSLAEREPTKVVVSAPEVYQKVAACMTSLKVRRKLAKRLPRD